jgi:hypothetical protein
MQRGLVLACAAALLLGGFSDDSGDPNAAPTAMVTVTETAPVIEPEPEPTRTEEADPYAPNVGDRALKIGTLALARPSVPR